MRGWSEPDDNLLDVLMAQAMLATAQTTLAQSWSILPGHQVDVFLLLDRGWTRNEHESEDRSGKEMPLAMMTQKWTISVPEPQSGTGRSFMSECKCFPEYIVLVAITCAP